MLCLGFLLLINFAKPTDPSPKIVPAKVTVLVSSKPINSFIPDLNLGAGVDGQEAGSVKKVFTKENIRWMRSTGMKSLTYRLRTELGIEAWHWNPRGKWSDPEHKQGYWTSNSFSKDAISTCYGYKLPRRGSTTDQANNDGYSRIDDGDSKTFWKSNPYLDTHFTHEPNNLHPQWVVINLGKHHKVNQFTIHWGNPYALKFQLQYWSGNDVIDRQLSMPGDWISFKNGRIFHGIPGVQTILLKGRPINARYLKIVLLASSETTEKFTTDIRDKLGFAIRELKIGLKIPRGRFRNCVRASKNRLTQNPIFVSSTDPWHRGEDRDKRIEQPGFDKVFNSSLTNDLPVLVPVSVLFDTPENMSALMEYMRERKYKIKGIELGEEPDGQLISAKDYGALYIQFADAIRNIMPKVKLGGPSMQTIEVEYHGWPIKPNNTTWIGNLVEYLKSRQRERDFQFFSFEWYPFDDTSGDTAPQLAQMPILLANSLRRLVKRGLPTNIPWVMTEYGYSAFAGSPEVDMAGAILNADIVGYFLTMGGSEAYLYGYEPNTLMAEKGDNIWGNNMILLADDEGKVISPVATYYGAKLLHERWVLPGKEPNNIYIAHSDQNNSKGFPLLSAYPLNRPDGSWAIMLINKSPDYSYNTSINFSFNKSHSTIEWDSFRTCYQYSPLQYKFKPNGANGKPIRCLPPEKIFLHDRVKSMILPPYSITIMVGHPETSW